MSHSRTAPMNRRTFFKLGLSTAVGGALAGSMSGCSSSSSSSSEEDGDLSGITLGMLNYEGWMGETEVDAFEDETGCAIEQYATPDGGDSAWVSKISQAEGAYDFALAGIQVADALNENGLLAEFDESLVPNLANIPDEYKEAYPYGIPVEQGKLGFIYNTELMETPPQSWAELFANAADYSGALVLPNFDSDVIDCGLMALGIDINTEDLDDIEAAKQAVIDIKPHIKAFLDSGAAEAVADGSATIAVAYDYDFAYVAPDAANIAWFVPEEGTFGYLDGWVPLADSENLDAVYEFMDFHLETENYVDFINTTWASWLMDGIADELDESIGSCEALDPSLASVTYQQPLPAEVTAEITAAFQEIQIA